MATTLASDPVRRDLVERAARKILVAALDAQEGNPQSGLRICALRSRDIRYICRAVLHRVRFTHAIGNL